jgi:serine/threonine-protein kinase
VQLIDAATDQHLWAEHYDRSLDDAFAIQSDVAQQIVAAVGTTLTSAEQGRLTAAPTANPEAYRLYLQGREYAARPGVLRQDLETAQQLCEGALRLDPDFALAHALLSEVHGGIYWYRYDPSATRAARQREEAETAVRLAPGLPQAHAAMGLAHYWGRRDYRRALDEFTIALKGLPNDAWLVYLAGVIERRLGNWKEVFAAFEKATQLDPRNAQFFYEGGGTYEYVHRYAEAVRAYDRALSLAPDLHGAAVSRGWAYVRWQGQLDTLRTVLGRIPRDADLGDMGSAAAQRVALLLWERNADGLLRELQGSRVPVFASQGSFLPSALYAGRAHQMRGDHAAARAAFDSARTFLGSVSRELADDWRVHAARGLALAGLGHRDEALRSATWLQQSEVYRKDAYGGTSVAEYRARILAQAGDADAALDEIERLLAGPSWLTVHTLRLDPGWDPIRQHPRFKALLVKYANPERPAR